MTDYVKRQARSSSSCRQIAIASAAAASKAKVSYAHAIFLPTGKQLQQQRRIKPHLLLCLHLKSLENARSKQARNVCARMHVYCTVKGPSWCLIMFLPSQKDRAGATSSCQQSGLFACLYMMKPPSSMVFMQQLRHFHDHRVKIELPGLQATFAWTNKTTTLHTSFRLACD